MANTVEVVVSIPREYEGYASTSGGNEDVVPPQKVIGGYKQVLVFDNRVTSFSIIVFWKETDILGGNMNKHAGALTLFAPEISARTYTSKINHRDVKGDGVKITIHSITGGMVYKKPKRMKKFDRCKYREQSTSIENTTELGKRLMPVWWHPMELEQPIPIEAFFSCTTHVPFTTEYLKYIITVAGGQMGYDYEGLQSASESARYSNPGTEERRLGQRLIWKVASLVSNCFPYHTDYIHFSNGCERLVDIFDFMLERGCGDCEDMSAEAYKLIISMQKNDGLGHFGELLRTYVPVILVGGVTSASVTYERDNACTGHVWMALIPKSMFGEIISGNRLDLRQEVIMVEGTGVVNGHLEWGRRDEERMKFTNQIISSSSEGVKDCIHEISLHSANGTYTFYKEVMDMYFPVGEEWPEKATVVNTETGKRGVTFHDFISGKFELRESGLNTKEIIQVCEQEMQSIVPERSPYVPYHIPKPLRNIEGAIVCTIIVPIGMEMPRFVKYREDIPEDDLGMTEGVFGPYTRTWTLEDGGGEYTSMNYYKIFGPTI